ncbi:hypothetical protein LguiB_005804 [Lonicera macranthoides]
MAGAKAESVSVKYNYDIFFSLSHRDRSSTDYLYKTLKDSGVRVFRDGDSIERSKDIRSEVKKAIELSRLCIVVLSKSYASSTWCLDQLVMMIECKRNAILPIFYDQKRRIGEEFARYEEQLKVETDYQRKEKLTDKIQGWSDALSFASDLPGFVLQNQADGKNEISDWPVFSAMSSAISPELLMDLFYRDELKFIQNIIEAVEEKVKAVQKDFVPMEAESEGGLLNQEPSNLAEDWTAMEINLRDTEELPENPNCPFLLKLVLEQSHDLTEIPDSFFDSMLVLQVLDLSNTSIKTLPRSIASLTKLQQFFLRDCVLLRELPPEIRELKNLEVFDLEGTELMCLPMETIGLLQLERLKVSLYRCADNYIERKGINAIIPRETLSKCSHLKELSILVDPDCEWWDAEVEAIINELPLLRNLGKLELLDLSNTSIKTLPRSIASLTKLQQFFLRDCVLLRELPPEIRELKNLEVFDLEGTELMCLPMETIGLLQLERLKVSLYRCADNYIERKGINAIIPRETLSKCSHLKELSILVDPDCEWWDAEVEAIINELPLLRNLGKLELYFPTLELLQKFLQFPGSFYQNLSNFRLTVGRHKQHIISSLPHNLQSMFEKLDKCLKYVNGKGSVDRIGKALKHARALFLDRQWTIEKLSAFKIDEMHQLNFCLVVECNEMNTIVDGGDFYEERDNGGKPILGSLSYVSVHYMKNLQSIWKGPIVSHCLSCLEILALHTCPKLTTIFNLALLRNLINLKELIVENCPKVKSLVSADPSSLEADSEFLPALEKILLLDLPELVSISGDLPIGPKLETIIFSNCPMLRNLSPTDMYSKYMHEIKDECEWSKALDSSNGETDYLQRVLVSLTSYDDSKEVVKISGKPLCQPPFDSQSDITFAWTNSHGVQTKALRSLGGVEVEALCLEEAETHPPLSAPAAMDLFHDTKAVCLRSHNDDYLTAEEDKKSVILLCYGSSKASKWTVEYVDNNLIRLKSCHGKYLTASNQPFLPGMTSCKVLQTLPPRLDSSIEWEPISDGNNRVKLNMANSYVATVDFLLGAIPSLMIFLTGLSPMIFLTGPPPRTGFSGMWMRLKGMLLYLRAIGLMNGLGDSNSEIRGRDWSQ